MGENATFLQPMKPGDKRGYKLVNALLVVFTSKGYRDRVKGYIAAGMNCLGNHPLGDPNTQSAFCVVCRSELSLSIPSSCFYVGWCADHSGKGCQVMRYGSDESELLRFVGSDGKPTDG